MSKKTIAPPPAVAALSDRFGFQIAGLARAYRRVIDRRMEPLDVSPSQWPLLLNLWYHEGATQQELADMLEMTRGGMNKLLNRLEAAGFLRREEGSDLRSKRIFLEDRMRPAVQAMDRIQQEVIAASVSGLSRAEGDELMRLLQKVQDAVDQLAAP